MTQETINDVIGGTGSRRFALVSIIVLVMSFALVPLMLAVGTAGALSKSSGIVAEKGVLDMSEYDFDYNDFSSYREKVALLGEWEFYWDRWLISDSMAAEEGSQALPEPEYVAVPSPWTSLQLGGETLPASGRATYRMVIENCPAYYVPIISLPSSCNVSYQVFVDGELTVMRGYMDESPEESFLSITDHRNNLRYATDAERWDHGANRVRDLEVVVEVSSDNADGLYMAPVMQCKRGHFFDARISGFAWGFLFAASALLMVMFLFVGRWKGMTKQTLAAGVLALVLLVLLALNTDLIDLAFLNRAFRDAQARFLIWQAASCLLPPLSTYAMEALLLIRFKRREHAAIWLLCAALLAFAIISRDSSPLQSTLLVSLASVAITCCAWVVALIRTVRSGGNVSIVAAFGILGACYLLWSLWYTGIIALDLSLVFGAGMLFFLAIVTFEGLRRGQAAEKLARQLEDAEIQLFLSQIKPHFMHNALMTIQTLCVEDPRTAERAIANFGTYLRANADALDTKDPIPFEQELRHVESYLAIEKLRFGDQLRIVMCCETVSFTLPALTLQPLVENAVKHGVRKKPGGGTITIRSLELPDAYCVSVEDDGPGFTEPWRPKGESHDERSHIGLHNIDVRLRSMMGARLEIESEPGKGTRAVVTIPKRDSSDDPTNRRRHA